MIHPTHPVLKTSTFYKRCSSSRAELHASRGHLHIARYIPLQCLVLKMAKTRQDHAKCLIADVNTATTIPAQVPCRHMTAMCVYVHERISRVHLGNN